MKLEDLKHSELMDLAKKHGTPYHNQSKTQMIKHLRPLFAKKEPDLKEKLEADIMQAHRSELAYYEHLISKKKAAPTMMKVMNDLRRCKELICNSKY